MAGNKQSFNLTVVASKSFSFILDSFDAAVTFLFRIKQKIPIQFISSASMKAVSNIVLKKIKMTVSNIHFIGKQVQTLNIKTIRLSVIIREIGKIATNINLKTIGISAIAGLRQKLVTGIILKKIKINFVGTYGTFYTLGVYDPQTLGTLDTKTLGEMDFTAIP